MSVLRSLIFISLTLSSSAAYAQQPAWPQPPVWPVITFWPMPFPTPFWPWPMPVWSYPPAPITVPTPLPAPLPAPSQETTAPPTPQATEITREVISAPAASLPGDKMAESPAAPPILEIPPAPAASVEAPSEKPVEAVNRPAAKQTPIKKPKVGRKPSKTPRKLCWKDGRLDVCP
ncbi:MAG: hypothetical protein Q8O79_02920 [Pseudomonadota bacterium]|nr:hypothetical protein [Pseudomonadota bacterium]